MVYSGEGNRVSEFMAMGPERSKALHNFTFPHLKWGTQKYLRCMKVESAGDTSTIDQRLRRRSPPSKLDNLSISTRRREAENQSRRLGNELEKRVKVSRPGADGEDGIEAVREKILFDLKTAADRMKDAIFREEVSGEEEEEKERETERGSEESPAAAEEVRPWNLRTRRAACKAPVGGGGSGGAGKGLKLEEKKLSFSPMRSEGGAKSPRLRGVTEKKERAKFSVSLSRKEIEEDFMEMVSHRPARRPKKRPRVVQKQLDTLFPGLWLTEVSADSYKVPELPENGKR